MQQAMRRRSTRRSLVAAIRTVLALSALVHAASTAADAGSKRKAAGPAKTQQSTPDGLTAGVREMLELIQAAIATGSIDDLRDAVDWNEMKPDFGTPGVTDPVVYWKAQSKDGSGRETLALLAALIEGPPAVVPYGRDLENNRLFVWPRLAEAPLKSLTPDDLIRFNRLVPEGDRGAMLAGNAYTGWRLVLGADGTWHTFRTGK